MKIYTVDWNVKVIWACPSQAKINYFIIGSPVRVGLLRAAVAGKNRDFENPVNQLFQ